MSEKGANTKGRSFGLAARFSLFVAVILTLVWAQGLGLLLMADRDAKLAKGEQVAQELAGFAASVAGPALSSAMLDPARLRDQLAPLMASDHVVGVAAFTPRGVLIWSGGARAAGEDIALLAAEARAAGRTQTRRNGRDIAAAAAAAGGGVIVLRIDANRLGAKDSGGVGIFALLFGLTLLVAIPLAAAFARRVAAPLARLTNFVETAAAQKPGARIEIATGDEIERLAAAFNDLLGRLEVSMRRIRRLAFFDTVTEMPNQEWFQRKVKHVLADLSQDPRPTPQGAVVLLRMNRLLNLADSLGQDAAQELLAHAGRRIVAAARTADRMVRREAAADAPCASARTGAAEFGILIPSISAPNDAARFAQLIASALAQPIEWRGQRLSVDCTSGVALLGKSSSDAESAMRQARLALRSASEDGRPVKFFTRALDRDANQRLALERQMREGVERDEFRAYFQPKLDLGSGKVVGCEALARWIRPDQSIISPGVFIPAAEENGLIGQIADAILRDACWKAAEWARAGHPMKVAVNVSALQFADDRFAPRVLAALDQAGLPPEMLELEITESVAMTNVDRVLHLIEPLRARNVSFAIDDFGTGHSSLASLTRLPFDVLKIDQSFVRGLTQDRNAAVIIETILAMAASLDFKTVAEGVETEEEAAFLRLRGCTIAQGYLFGAPMAAADFLDRLGSAKSMYGRSYAA